MISPSSEYAVQILMRFPVVEGVESGEDHGGEAVHARGVSSGDGIEPSYPACASGRSSELTCHFADAVTFLAVYLGWERTGADTR